jgi:hypothetical protein
MVHRAFRVNVLNEHGGANAERAEFQGPHDRYVSGLAAIASISPSTPCAQSQNNKDLEDCSSEYQDG